MKHSVKSVLDALIRGAFLALTFAIGATLPVLVVLLFQRLFKGVGQ